MRAGRWGGASSTCREACRWAPSPGRARERTVCWGTPCQSHRDPAQVSLEKPLIIPVSLHEWWTYNIEVMDSGISDLVDLRDEVMEVEEAGVESFVVQARVERHPFRIIILKEKFKSRQLVAKRRVWFPLSIMYFVTSAHVNILCYCLIVRSVCCRPETLFK